MLLLTLLLETVIEDPPVVDDDEFDDDDVDVDWEAVDDDDIEAFPVPELTTLTVDNITQVAAGDTTYPVTHFTHLKSVVNYWQFNGILLAKPNICNKYNTPEFLMSNVIVLELELVEVDMAEVVVVVVGVTTGTAVDDVVLTVFVFCDVWYWLVSWVVWAGRIFVDVGTNVVCVCCWLIVVPVFIFKAFNWFCKFTCCWYKASSTQISLTITNPALQVSHLPETKSKP